MVTRLEPLGIAIPPPETEEEWANLPRWMNESRGVLVVNDLDVDGPQLDQFLQKVSKSLGHKLLEYDRWPGQSPGVAGSQHLALLGNYKARKESEIVEGCKVGEAIAEYKPATLELSEWHTDGSFLSIPKTYIALYAPVANDALPLEGGQTRFSSTELVSREEEEEFRNWSSVHSWKSFMRFLEHRDPNRPKVTEAQCAAKPDQTWPLVFRKGSQRQSYLYINAKNTRAVYDGEGKAVDVSIVYELTQRLLDRGVYWHQWKPGQLVVWDNQTTIHAATPFDASKYERLLYRAEFAPHYVPCRPDTVTLGYLDATCAPVATLGSGDTVVVDTVCGPRGVPPEGFTNVPPEYFDILRREEEEKPTSQWETRVGPHTLTGPIAIEGAVPGDVLQIDILDVRLRSDWAYTLHKPSGELRHTKLSPLGGGWAETEFGSRLECHPFFGILGLAPEPSQGRMSSIPPSSLYGGNLDLKKLTAGTTLYIPVQVPGALLFVGDGHARQGDGECCGTALETSLTGKFRLTLHKETSLSPSSSPTATASLFHKTVRAETPDEMISIGVEDTIDKAVTSAVERMVEWIQQVSSLSAVDAEVLCSIAGDVAVTQFVNGDTRGAHVTLQKSHLPPSH